LQCLGITQSALSTDLPYTTPLPGTGTTVGEIINRILSSAAPSSPSSNNPLVQFLYHLDPYDLESLQRGVRVYSSSYRYYEYDTAMTKIPIADKAILPSGGAINQLAWKLSKIKRTGIVNVSQRCQVSALLSLLSLSRVSWTGGVEEKAQVCGELSLRRQTLQQAKQKEEETVTRARAE
jgi:hypothetical protein